MLLGCILKPAKHKYCPEFFNYKHFSCSICIVYYVAGNKASTNKMRTATYNKELNMTKKILFIIIVLASCSITPKINTICELSFRSDGPTGSKADPSRRMYSEIARREERNYQLQQIAPSPLNIRYLDKRLHPVS